METSVASVINGTSTLKGQQVSGCIQHIRARGQREDTLNLQTLALPNVATTVRLLHFAEDIREVLSYFVHTKLLDGGFIDLNSQSRTLRHGDRSVGFQYQRIGDDFTQHWTVAYVVL